MNLSHALALRGQRVLLIDLDSQANCTSGLGIDPPPLSSIYPVLLGSTDIRQQFIPTNRPNLTFVPSEMDLAGIEIELARSDDHLTLASHREIRLPRKTRLPPRSRRAR